MKPLRANTVLADRGLRIAHAWGLNPCLPSPPGSQVRTAPNASPPASGADSDLLHRSTEILGGVAGACSGIKCGENRTERRREARDSVERHATNPVANVGEGANGAIAAAPYDPASRDDDGADRRQPASSGFTGEDDGRDVEASGGAASVITLSDASAFILSLVAAHQGRPAGDILAQLIVGAAEAIGIHSLILRDAAEIDLADVPDFARRAANRFRGCGP